jgi:hypothetical protein
LFLPRGSHLRGPAEDAAVKAGTKQSPMSFSMREICSLRIWKLYRDHHGVAGRSYFDIRPIHMIRHTKKWIMKFSLLADL